MDLHEALYTTRAMRRVRPDPIPYEVQARILDAAIRAPSGGNQQNWRFLWVDDPAQKAALAPLYQHAMGELWKTVYKAQLDAAHADPEAPEAVQMFKVQRSAQWLADNFETVPLYLFPFSQYDPRGFHLPRRVEGHAGRPRRRRRELPDGAPPVLPPDQDLRDPRRPRRPGLAPLGHRQLRLPDGDLGRAPRRPVHEANVRNKIDKWIEPPFDLLIGIHNVSGHWVVLIHMSVGRPLVGLPPCFPPAFRRPPDLRPPVRLPAAPPSFRFL